nr:hypothetical protein [uncultured Roseateles sp.]
MYTVNAEDHPREISTLPQSSVGAPCPMLVADEHTLRIGYYLEEARLTSEWSRFDIRPPASDDADDLCAVVTFTSVHAHMFGPPNDEAFSGHPLASRGLGPYGAFEVDRSSWRHSLERMNSLHPYHRPERFARYKHFILSFHDTTFECLAEAFSVSLRRGSVWRVLLGEQNEV